jgi:DNA-binding NarL/FixJ family response regulator
VAEPRPLTRRQREIIDLLTLPGATQQSVADVLGISVQTIKNHLTVAYRTLGVRSLAQAARAKRKRAIH